MKAKLVLLLFSLTSLNFAQVVPQLEFFNLYNGPGNGDVYINDIQTDNNFNLYLAGRSAGSDTSFDLYVQKYSKKGDLLLNIIYPAPWHWGYEANSVAVDKNENIYVTGGKVPYSSSSWSAIFRKYSASGDLLWDKYFPSGPNVYSVGEMVILDNMGNPITGINIHGIINIIKYSAAGDSLWSIQIKGDTIHCSLNYLMPDPNGNIFASIKKEYWSGYSDVPEVFYDLYKISKDGAVVWQQQEYKGYVLKRIVFDKNSDMYTGTHQDNIIFKYDSNGALKWTYELAGFLTDMKVDGNNDIIITGGRAGTGGIDYLTAKISSEGKLVWNSQFNSDEDLSDEAFCLCLDQENNIYVTGASFDKVPKGICYTIKYSPEGKILWKLRFADTTGRLEYPGSIYLDDSSNVFIRGNGYHPSFGSTIFFMKIKQETGTLVESNGYLPKRFNLNQNYPNPFNPATTISYSIAKQSFVDLKVVDMLGREVTTLVSKEQSAGEYKVQFNGSNLPSGMYIFSIKAGEFRDSKKMILIK